MKIIIINDYGFVQGGASQVAINSAQGLAEAGHEVFFVYGVGPASPDLEHPNIKLIDLQQYDLISNPSRVNAALSGVWNREAEKSLSIFLKREVDEDTVVHVHAWVKSLSASVVRASLKETQAVVVTLHDYFTACPNGGFYNYQTGQSCHLEPMSLSCLATNCDARSYPQKLWRFIRQGVASASGVPRELPHVIYVSSFSKEILRPYLSSNTHYWHVPNPINVRRVDPFTPSATKNFSYIGRLALEKGVLTLAEVAKSHPEYSVRFVGTGELKEMLKKELPHAAFTGWADREQMDNYLARTRALIFPSNLYETQGMTVAEAAALGVPSIVSDTCAARDYVEHEYTGLLFKGGDAEALHQAMMRLLEDPGLADRLGRNAYERFWQSPPTLEQHISQLESSYRKIIDKA